MLAVLQDAVTFTDIVSFCRHSHTSQVQAPQETTNDPSTSAAITSPDIQPVTVEVESAKPLSRTTDWSRRKATGEAKVRKVYTCKTCGKPMTGN